MQAPHEVTVNAVSVGGMLGRVRNNYPTQTPTRSLICIGVRTRVERFIYTFEADEYDMKICDAGN